MTHPVDVTIYTTAWCPYCRRAKELLVKKNLAFNEIDVEEDIAQRGVMRKRAGGRNSVPQIFINDTHVGGCDDLVELDRSGKLDTMLSDLAQ